MAKPSANERKRRQRILLYRIQNGICYYCKRTMFIGLDGRVPSERMDGATIEHLHPIGHPERGKHGGERTHVLACRKCNGEENLRFVRSLPKEELWRRSGRYPQEMGS